MTSPAQTADKRPYFTVIERNGWFYIEGKYPLQERGPWRYRWEAQDRADEMNAKVAQ